ncbi:unnamed protein product, partial [Laminaria digitata]
EANAQLCLKLQGLGLEYAGLTRELLDSGSKLPYRGGRLGIADLDSGNYSDDLHRGTRRRGDTRDHRHRLHPHHHHRSSSSSSSKDSRNDRRRTGHHHHH